MADSGYVIPNGRIVVAGSPRVLFRSVEDATKMIPGRTVIRGSSDKQIKVGDALNPVLGLLGFEGADPTSRPIDRSTAYAADSESVPIEAPVLTGRDFAVLGKLAKGFVAAQGEDLFSWSEGRLVPGMEIDGSPAIRVPFVKKAAEYDTGIKLPAGVVIEDVFVKVDTLQSGATIDVGTLSTESSGDPDGLVDGESCAAAGMVVHNLVDATEANITLGALLKESDIKTADGTALFAAVKKQPGYKVDVLRTLSYTTSNHDVVGSIFLKISSSGVKKMGIAAISKDASSADADIVIEAVI
ncbi:MAG: hypothetical protein LLG45_13365 [Actinomycetia bacterium]|nr:hypothetical protein [Actinomycetes bacterium]